MSHECGRNTARKCEDCSIVASMLPTAEFLAVWNIQQLTALQSSSKELNGYLYHKSMEIAV